MKSMANTFEVVDFANNLGAIFFVTNLLNPDQLSFHWHHAFEFIMAIDDGIRLVLEEKVFELKSGDFILINSDQAHCIQPAKEENQVLIIQIAPSFCEKYFADLKNIHFTEPLIRKTPTEQYRTFYRFFMETILALRSEEAGYEFLVMQQLNGMFYWLMQNIPHRKVETKMIERSIKNFQRIRRTVQFVNENYSNKITLTEIADREEVNVYYLSREIKKHLGMSFQEYLNMVRLNKAKELLLTTDLRGLDISIECGFSDYKYFSHLIKERYGCSPIEFRKRLRNDKELRRSIELAVANEDFYRKDDNFISYMKAMEYIDRHSEDLS